MRQLTVLLLKISISTTLLMSLVSCGAFESSSKNGSSSGLESSFSCNSTEDLSESGSFFLSKKQLSNTIEDLFGIGALAQLNVALSTLPSESYDSDLRKRTSTISNEKIQAYFNIAKDTADYVVSNNARISNVFGSCASSSSFTPTCTDDYIKTLELNS